VRARSAIAKDTLAMWTSMFFTQFVGFFLAVFIRRELGPEQMGVWALLQVFVGYSSYAGLGIYDAALREIPICRGRGDTARAQLIRNVTWTFTLATSAAVSALVLAYLLVEGKGLSPVVFWGVASLLVLIPLQRVSNFLIGFLYVEKQFTLAGRFKTYSAIANAVFTFAGVLWAGIYGFYAAMIASFAYNIAYLRWKAPVELRFGWNNGEFKKLASFSVALLVIGAMNTFLVSADRLAIGRFLGLEALGVYTLATMGSGFVLTFAYMFSATVYPRVLEKYGEKGNAAEVVRIVRLPSLFLSAYLPMAAGLIWSLAPWLTQRVLHEYQDGLPALRALMFGAVFLALTNQTNQMIYALDRQRRMIVVYLISLATAAFAYGFARMNAWGSVEIYAWAAAFTFFTVYTLQSLYALRGTMSFARRSALWARITGLIGLNAAFLYCVDHIVPAPDGRSALLRAVIFFILSWAASLTVEKEVRFYAVLREFINRKKALKPAEKEQVLHEV
jgi:O-antigen/teichoic acid export membrane protein